MTDHAPKEIRIEGLSESDALDIRESLDTWSVKASEILIKENSLPPHKLGEPVTFILVAAITSAAIGIVGAWLLKKEKQSSLHYTLTLEYADGTKKTETLILKRSESEAPSPELIEKLSSITNLPTDDLVKLITQSS